MYFEQTFISNGHQILFYSLWNKSQMKFDKSESDIIENFYLYFESKSKELLEVFL